MSDASIHQPHDKLFKAGFSDPANAAGLLRTEIPETISTHIAWDQLQLEPGSFVDSHYRHTESDLLFSAPFSGTRCLIYILFEHQMAFEPLLALRLLRYMVRIWEKHLNAHPASQSLPVILPVVLAQNAEPWKLSPRFSALFDVPADAAGGLRPFIPDFTFRLIQLAELPFETIGGTPSGIMILRTMKAERIGKLLDDPVWDETLIIQMPREMFEGLVHYMLNTDVDKDGFDARVQGIKHSQTKTTAMTLADQLRQEGIQEGRQEGRQEGVIVAQQKAVLDALEIRFTTVPDGLRESIMGLDDEAHLRRLLRASIQAASLEDFSKAL